MPKTSRKKKRSKLHKNSTSANDCRICHDPCEQQFYPCLCKSPVHNECFETWINTSKRDNCEVCLAELRYESKIKCCLINKSLNGLKILYSFCTIIMIHLWRPDFMSAVMDPPEILLLVIANIFIQFALSINNIIEVDNIALLHKRVRKLFLHIILCHLVGYIVLFLILEQTTNKNILKGPSVVTFDVGLVISICLYYLFNGFQILKNNYRTLLCIVEQRRIVNHAA